MNTGKLLTVVLVAGALVAGAGILGQRYLHPAQKDGSGNPGPTSRPVQTLDSLPEFSLPDLQGRQRHSSQWAGKLLVLNFWATWCPPCRKEIPDFMALQDELGTKGLQFVGIAIDQAEAVREFAENQGINYPALIGDERSIELSRRLGNRFQGLPFSAIFDRQGKLIHTQAGQLHPDTIREQLSDLL